MSISTTPLPSPLIAVQQAFIVPDLDRACAEWIEAWRTGPFVGGGVSVLDQHQHRGQPAPPITLRAAFVQHGGMVVEFIQLLSDGPSAFHDLSGDGVRLHHLAVFCPDVEAETERSRKLGMPVASQVMTRFGAPGVFIDARARLGCMIELYPEHPAIRGLYRQTREAADNWDGRTIMQPWGPIAPA